MPSPGDVVVEVRNGPTHPTAPLGRVGFLDPAIVGDGKFVKRKDQVGAWQLSLPAEHPLTPTLKTPGAGILVWLYGRVYLSGRMVHWENVTSSSNLDGTCTFTGPDDMQVLADDLAWPQPANVDPSGQAVTNDVRTGPAETLIKQYVSANIGPIAPAARRVGYALLLDVQPDQQRGPTVTGSPRFQVLGELASQLTGVDGGTTGFDVVQAGGRDRLILSHYVVRDRTDVVRMDVANDLLEKSTSGLSAPTTTWAIVAGQGEGTTRTFLVAHDAQADLEEQRWGFRAAAFADRRDTDDPDKLTQEGATLMAEEGRTVPSLKVEPSDGESMRYGRDWGVGDRVGVVVDGQVLTDVVSEAVLVVDEGDVRVGATVGDPVGYDWEAAVTQRQDRLSRRLGLIERAQ